MKILSWNINGLRSIVTKGFHESIEKLNPDMICLQETRVSPGVIQFDLIGFHEYINAATRKGYSGTAILSRIKPRSIQLGMNLPNYDDEGRVLTAEFEDFFLVNVYVPNSKRDLSRLDYRQAWDGEFLSFIKKLDKKKPVIFCGDLNVAHQEIDLANPKANAKNHGFTPEERRGFDNILRSGFLDSFRMFHQGGGHYTWWSQMNDCRKRNIGWRLDYICVSQKLKSNLSKAWIATDIMGSDHCPVLIELQSI